MGTQPPVSQINVPPGFIDLGLGDPPYSLLPLEMIRRAAEARFAEADPAFLQYGAEQGDGHFRLALADFLGQGYGFPVHPDRLFVTNGVSNALDMICTLFTRPGDPVFVEEPSYFLALRIFADHGLQVIPIDTDADGLVIESLEEKLAGTRPKFLYVIPTFQNPSGRTLTQERRVRLVELSQEHDFLILADEVYHFLSYAGRPPMSLAGYLDGGNVLSLGSFSKILAPGLRLGWIQAGPQQIKRLAGAGVLDSGGGLNPFTSAIVRGAIESGGLAENISKLADIYRQRVAFMDLCLRKYVPAASYGVPSGGYFFWVAFLKISMPPRCNARRRHSRSISVPESVFRARTDCASISGCASSSTGRSKSRKGWRGLDDACKAARQDGFGGLSPGAYSEWSHARPFSMSAATLNLAPRLTAVFSIK